LSYCLHLQVDIDDIEANHGRLASTKAALHEHFHLDRPYVLQWELSI